jgi:outer membrane receptor protein involved in Fe transport
MGNVAPKSKTLKDLLDMKVTSASKTLQKLELAPATVIVITKEQIKSRGYQSLLDAMYDLPEVKVDDKIYPGIRNSFTVRGTQGSEKFVILLDGITISSPSGEALPIMENYPVNLAEQIEIVYGPASALYGANAVSGIINIITKKVPSRKGMNIEASSVGGSYGYTNSSLFITKKLNEHMNFIVSGQYSYDKGADYSKIYKDDSSLNISSYSSGLLNSIYGPTVPAKPVRPKYEAPMAAYNIYAAVHSNDFTFTYFRNFSKIPTAFGNNTSNAIYNKEVSMAQITTTANASYIRSFDGIISTTSFTASEYNLSPQSNYRNLYTNMEPAYKYSTCSMLKGEEQFDYNASEKFNLTAGAGFEKYSAIPQSADLEEPVNTKDYIHASYLGTDTYYRPEGLPAQFYFIKYNNISSYLQTQYSPVEKIHITIGGRYDMNSRYGNTFNPRMGLVYKPSDRTVLKLLYGSAYLAPSPSDSYVQYGSFDTPDSGRTYHANFLHLPNPGLKPIKSKNAELSIQQYLTDNLSLTMNGYYTVLTGLHQFADDSKTTKLYNNSFNGIPVDYVEVFVNEGRQMNYGGSIQLNWKHAINNIHLNSYASLSYVNGKIDNPAKAIGNNDGDKQLDFISPFMFRIGTDLKTGKFTCSPRLLLIGQQNLPGIRDTVGIVARRQTIPGYALLNISLRYNITKHASFFANVSNALNRRYRSVGFNMDLTNKNSELFYGQPEDPIRIAGGFNLSL